MRGTLTPVYAPRRRIVLDMTAPDQPPENPFLVLARQIAAAPDDQAAADLFHAATGLTGDPKADRQELARRATLRARGGAEWDCEAYGPHVPAAIGPLCFLALVEPCRSAGECSARLVPERERVFGRMRELAAGGPYAAAYQEALVGVDSPDQLLGGPGDRPDRQDG